MIYHQISPTQVNSPGSDDPGQQRWANGDRDLREDHYQASRQLL